MGWFPDPPPSTFAKSVNSFEVFNAPGTQDAVCERCEPCEVSSAHWGYTDEAAPCDGLGVQHPILELNAPGSEQRSCRVLCPREGTMLWDSPEATPLRTFDQHKFRVVPQHGSAAGETQRVVRGISTTQVAVVGSGQEADKPNMQKQQSSAQWLMCERDPVLEEGAALAAPLPSTASQKLDAGSSGRFQQRPLHWSGAGVPVASRWGRTKPRLHPWYNPDWLARLQQTFPWYPSTLEAGGGPWLSWRAWEVPYQCFTHEFLCRWRSRGDRWFLLIRSAAVFCLILVLFIVNITPGIDLYDIRRVKRIYDAWHQATMGLNARLQSHPTELSILILIASFMMDMMVLLIWGQWVVLGDSFRLPIAYTLLYTIRALMRSCSLLPYPPDYIWQVPKFGEDIRIRSLVVPYQLSDDFFFSGHVGCGILAVSEHFYYRCWWGVIFSSVVTAFQTFVMTATRAHYFIDMFTGAVVASWIHILSQSITLPVDQWCGLPPRPVPFEQREARTLFNTSSRESQRSIPVDVVAEMCPTNRLPSDEKP